MEFNSERTFGWPPGKSIEEPTLAIFEKANIRPHFAHPRSCVGTFKDLPGIDTCLRIKPSVLAVMVARGEIGSGITGLDLVIEQGLSRKVKIIATLAYSRASNGGTRAVLVGRRGTAASLDELRRTKKPVVSEYPKQTRRFLQKSGISAPVHPCPGGAETLVVAGLYDYCVVLVETGTSLLVNDLVEITTIFESQTVLIANPAMYAKPQVRESVDHLARLLLGVIDARDKRYLTMNVPKERLNEVVVVLPSLESPTVQTLANGDFAVSSVVPLDGLAALKFGLMKAGASGIVELNALSIM